MREWLKSPSSLDRNTGIQVRSDIRAMHAKQIAHGIKENEAECVECSKKCWLLDVAEVGLKCCNLCSMWYNGWGRLGGLLFSHDSILIASQGLRMQLERFAHELGNAIFCQQMA